MYSRRHASSFFLASSSVKNQCWFRHSAPGRTVDAPLSDVLWPVEADEASGEQLGRDDCSHAATGGAP
jgi:hypothetical protein